MTCAFARTIMILVSIIIEGFALAIVAATIATLAGVPRSALGFAVVAAAAAAGGASVARTLALAIVSIWATVFVAAEAAL